MKMLGPWNVKLLVIGKGGLSFLLRGFEPRQLGPAVPEVGDLSL